MMNGVIVIKMYKSIYSIISSCLVLTFFIANILFLIANVNFRTVIIIETVIIPFMYVLTWLIDKGVL